MRLDATLSAIRQGGSEKSRILHEMLYADLGIKDIRITGSKEEPIISALHTLDAEDGTSKGFWLPLGQESVGTRRFFSRIGMWLAALESGAVLVVDEIESSMHPLLTRHLIEMVQDAAINTNHAQLIFTTHDTGLLDLTLLRRDQIWFAEKDEKTMQTDIYALTEFSPRKGENISKRLSARTICKKPVQVQVEFRISKSFLTLFQYSTIKFHFLGFGFHFFERSFHLLS